MAIVPRRLGMEGLRFFWVSLGGVAIDLPVSTVCLILGFGPAAAALTGLAVATVGAYFFHTRWTFVHVTNGQICWRGFIAFVAGTALVALVRLGVIKIFEPLIPAGLLWSVMLLAGAAEASFCANFIFSKLVVFRLRPDSWPDANT